MAHRIKDQTLPGYSSLSLRWQDAPLLRMRTSFGYGRVSLGKHAISPSLAYDSQKVDLYSHNVDIMGWFLCELFFLVTTLTAPRSDREHSPHTIAHLATASTTILNLCSPTFVGVKPM